MPTVSLEPTRTAVVLLEMQRQWTDPGVFNRFIAGQLSSQKRLARPVPSSCMLRSCLSRMRSTAAWPA